MRTKHGNQTPHLTEIEGIGGAVPGTVCVENTPNPRGRQSPLLHKGNLFEMALGGDFGRDGVVKENVLYNSYWMQVPKNYNIGAHKSKGRPNIKISVDPEIYQKLSLV